jgi:hypothetical protein
VIAVPAFYLYAESLEAMDKRHFLYIGLILLVGGMCTFQACSSKKKKIRRLQNFDSAAWISDRKGCSGTRLDMKDDLLRQKYRMRGLKTGQIEDLLGRPDAEELYNRNQKYYIYFLEAGPGCPEPGAEIVALYVRFTAVGIANEITLRKFRAGP